MRDMQTRPHRSPVQPASGGERFCCAFFFTSFLQLVGSWFTPPLLWDGGTARTAIQIHAVKLVELG